MEKLNGKRLSLLLLLLLALILVPMAHAQTQGESDLEYVRKKGKLIIGYTVYAPMNYTDEKGNFTGFDTELAIIVTRNSALSHSLSRLTGAQKK